MADWRMRALQPRDVPRVLELARIQNDRDGTDYPVPLLFGPDGLPTENSALALVAEHRGVVEQLNLFERTTELMVFGTNPAATAFSQRQMKQAAYLLNLRGYHGVHCYVPKQQLEHIEGPLSAAGYSRCDERLAHFFRSLVE